jgi:hypothetical protein
MVSNDLSDPVVVEADRRAERARASLRSRFAELEHRFGDVRERLDVAEHIRHHPWPAVGIALALGALAGGRGGARSAVAATTERSLGGAALAGLAAIGLRVAREIVLTQLARGARQWIEERGGSAEPIDADELRAAPGRPPLGR